MSVRLVCPLCGTLVVDGEEPRAGRCPGCGARFAGGGDDPPGATALALEDFGAPALPADALARRLFELAPGDPLARRAAITSDRRDGFYRWWVFVRDEDGGAESLLAEVLGG